MLLRPYYGRGLGASGQTLVEFALIIPIFLLLMLGVVQMVVVGRCGARGQPGRDFLRTLCLAESELCSEFGGHLPDLHRVTAHQ